MKLHTEQTYFVSMMGYTPGFPYLTGMNKRLFVNHTGGKKTFIPAGSVIIEGKKTGITTTDTYGDWLVIGYTPVRLFNPELEDFTKLKLGDNVKFVRFRGNAGFRRVSTMSIIIEGEGLFSSFQDFGRKGYEHDGVIPGGALDPLSHEIANRLVANDKNEATLEMTNRMASFRFTEPTLIALSGEVSKLRQNI